MYTTYGTYDYGYNAGAAAASAGAAIGLAIFYWILCIVVCVALIIGLWKVFVKAGKPGWYAIIPVYSMWALLELGDQKGFWCLVPVANIIFYVKACLSINKKFAKPTWFAFLMIFVLEDAFIILGFSKNIYVG